MQCIRNIRWIDLKPGARIWPSPLGGQDHEKSKRLRTGHQSSVSANRAGAVVELGHVAHRALAQVAQPTDRAGQPERRCVEGHWPESCRCLQGNRAAVLGRSNETL